MRSKVSVWLTYSAVSVVVLSASLWAADAWALAHEGAPATVFGTGLHRSIWDLALKYINFIILVVVIVKYAREPLKDFLMGERTKTARTIEQAEEKKRLAEEKLREGQEQLQISEDRLAQIQERIVTEGERRKEQMIADAQEESRLMMTAAQNRIEGQIREAYETIRGELIDLAYESALARLPGIVTATDQQDLVRAWLDEAQALAG